MNLFLIRYIPKNLAEWLEFSNKECQTLYVGLATGAFLTLAFTKFQANRAKRLKIKQEADKNKKLAEGSGLLSSLLNEEDEAALYKKSGYLVKSQIHNGQTKLARYLRKYGMFENDLHLHKIASRTQSLPNARMMGDPLTCQLMALINMAQKASSHIEVGVYTGYNLLQQALQLRENNPGPDGNFMVYGLDNTVGYFFYCRHHFAEAGIYHQNVDLKIQPAINSLDEMLEEKDPTNPKEYKYKGKIDSCFIDANKDQYEHYYDKCVELVRPGGFIFIDNVLWSGKVAEYDIYLEENDGQPGDKFDVATRALHELNVYVRDDLRTKSCILPFGDGLLVAVKI